MAVFRIEKTRDYTVMSNYHLRDMSLSLKAKGLLSLMLSLPENWDYTMKGLARICKDGIDSISGGIRELEAHGYLIRSRVRSANGQLGSIEYTILEQPKAPSPTPAILGEFISRIEVHERDQKRARYAIQHISIYFNYIGKFENEVTQLAEPTEQEIRQMREEIEEAKKEKSRAYHRNYSREYRARNLEKQREYDRMKAREYRARRKAQAAAAQPAQ